MMSVIGTDSYAFVEPSAGCGNFLFDNTTLAIDILPENENVQCGDWLTTNLNPCKKWVVYGNPPFGKRNNLSRQFITHAISQPCVEWVCFVLPAVYKKHTLQKVFKNWSLIADFDLDSKSFYLPDGSSYKIPSVFQVWRRGIHDGRLNAIERTNFENKHFIMSSGGGDVFVLGASPSTVKYPEDVTKNNRGYWLTSRIPVDTLKSLIETTPWQGNACANGGVYWLTKTEFINQYENYNKDSKNEQE